MPAGHKERLAAAKTKAGDIDYEELDEADLVYLCGRRGLDASGSMKELRKRLEAADDA
jgi:hypothetical protein